MTTEERWQLPDGIDELLPPQALALERLRRASLDLLNGWGYELVEPPVIEYLDALLSGMGPDLDAQTFKLIDQLSGRMLGVRADMTPQIARIDAHRLRHEGPTRLCYAGPILHTTAEKFAGSRNPVQLGAELYGYEGIAADAEILALLRQVLRLAGISDPCIDFGHVGVFRGLIAAAGVTGDGLTQLLAALQRKDREALRETVKELALDASMGAMLNALSELSGDPEILDEADRALARAPASVTAVLQELREFVGLCRSRIPDCRLHIDLAEQSSYQYHTGFIFAAYVSGQGTAIAAGGRYEGIGRMFGRFRAATGFSTDLKHLAKLATNPAPAQHRIVAPNVDDAALEVMVRRLRAEGEIVVRELPGENAARGRAQRRLVKRDNGWELSAAEE